MATYDAWNTYDTLVERFYQIISWWSSSNYHCNTFWANGWYVIQWLYSIMSFVSVLARTDSNDTVLTFNHPLYWEAMEITALEQKKVLLKLRLVYFIHVWIFMVQSDILWLALVFNLYGANLCWAYCPAHFFC